jgi:ribonuclease P protein component
MPQNRHHVETLVGFEAFSRIIAKGSRVERKPLRAYVNKAIDETSKTRIGIAVTRQIRTSVERNKLKRLLREAIRNEEHCLTSLTTALEIVIMYVGNREIAPKKVRFFSIEKATKELFALIAQDQRS